MASNLLFHAMSSLTLLIFALCVSQAVSRRLQESESHEQWMSRYGRVYKNAAEKESRLKIYDDNVKYIKAANAEPDKSYKLGINAFADLTFEEFEASYLGYKPWSENIVTRFRYENVTKVPISLDWRSQGAVTPMKNQGMCGSCWAFSAVGAPEGITKLSTSKLMSLAEQQIVDCDVLHGTDQGCAGGYMEDAVQFVIRNGGISDEASYPYKAVDEICNTSTPLAANITGFEIVSRNNESDLQKAVRNQPVSVSLSVSRDFMLYASGVFTRECGTDLNHGVTAIGYGEDEVHKYWILKNSWGTSWEMKDTCGFKEMFNLKKVYVALQWILAIPLLDREVWK